MDATVPLGALVGAAVATVVGSFFAAADTAVHTLTDARLAALIEESSGRTKAALERISARGIALRSRYLLGRIVCATCAAVLLTVAFSDRWPAFAPYIAGAVTVIVSGTLFEMSTTLGKRFADRAAPTLSRLLLPLEFALLPFSIPLEWIGRMMMRGAKESKPNPRIVEHEVENMVDQAEKSGLFGRGPGEIIRNVLEFADLTAKDVMVPRTKMEAIDLANPPEQVLRQVVESGHSRYPVYKGQLDDIVGLIYAKDLFRALENAKSRQINLWDLVRPAHFVAPSLQLVSLLRLMRRKRHHMTIVVDELGAVSGIVTLEDVLEEIVGDIQDEHDDASESPVQEVGGGRFVAAGDVSMGDLSMYLGVEIAPDASYDSLGGMLVHVAGTLPKRGTEIDKFGMRFRVLDADDTRIQKVEIVKLDPARSPLQSASETGPSRLSAPLPPDAA